MPPPNNEIPAPRQSRSETGAAQQGGNTIIVGIDFGTTYSGVAFTWSNKIDQIDVITSWEADLPQNSDEVKAPTAISYSGGKVTWGYGIPVEAQALQWFKLLLIDSKDLSDEVRDSVKIKQARDAIRKQNRTPISIIAEYLRHLWEHCLKQIGTSISNSLVRYSKFHVVITVPAIWPQYARSRMREAARYAGILDERIGGPTQLDIISEPEAAALATLRDMKDRCDIEPGDSFVVVDCGGGTADLISYEVTSTSPMAVKECVQGDGGLFGAVFVDEAFVKILSKKFGEKAWNRMSPRTRQRLINDEWEHGIKPAFDGRDRTWTINMPTECLDIRDLQNVTRGGGKVEITADDVRTAFETVIGNIGSLVSEQIAGVKARKNKPPKYVILVGGFGRCKYLLSSLERFVDDGVEILQSRGTGPWTAICRGAVVHAASMRGLGSFTVDVESRIARASYGIKVREQFDPDLHDVRDKIWYEDRQQWYADNQMTWTLKAGDLMVTNEPVRFPLLTLYPKSTRRITNKVVDLYTCLTSPPPKRYEAGVEELPVSIEWDTEIDASTLPIYVNPKGQEFYELHFEVLMLCVGGTIEFSCYYNGERQGSVNVVAEHTVQS